MTGETEIELVVNGESERVAAGTSLESLIEGHELDPRAVAVEHNGEILSRSEYAATTLDDGDRLEIVRFVQGG